MWRRITAYPKTFAALVSMVLGSLGATVQAARFWSFTAVIAVLFVISLWPFTRLAGGWALYGTRRLLGREATRPAWTAPPGDGLPVYPFPLITLLVAGVVVLTSGGSVHGIRVLWAIVFGMVIALPLSYSLDEAYAWWRRRRMGLPTHEPGAPEPSKAASQAETPSEGAPSG